MKKILVLGAGLVAKPLVQYLLDQPEFEVEVASLEIHNVTGLVENHPRGKISNMNLKNEQALKDKISRSDMVISIVPPAFHPKVAKYCIDYKKNMITTSYVSEVMKNLESEAKKAGVIILNEMGLDPGIDHMEAMRIIEKVKEKGGKILSFTSYCGGLPAPESNTNPLGYKFSWRPRGALLAGKNSAQYLKEGHQVFVPSGDLFDHFSLVPIEGLGEFEGYPNRNSFPYIHLYGIRSTHTALRGTLRYKGWCATLKKIVDIGLLDEKRMDWTGYTFKDFILHLINKPGVPDVRKALSQYLNIPVDSEIIERLEWLGLLRDEPLPLEKGAPLEILSDAMWKRLQYGEGERDMVVLKIALETLYPEAGKESIESTLIHYGEPQGNSAMSRTVGLPAAIGAKLILQRKINTLGVQRPVQPEIYKPILHELKKFNISFKEKRIKI
ncbi:saccharopine dehydrogenase NADP-binding domain-containing protein [bacterium]|nr:saccharopine dehydrogenase NADP-binding domain-containing protein [bacterium]